MLKVKIIALVLVLLVIGMQIRHQYQLGQAGQPAYAAEGKLPTNGVALNIDTHGEVPGNPKAEIAKFQQLAVVLSTYSKIHDGAYPPSGTDLLKDILGNMPAYGFHNFQQVTSLFFNPDSKFADDPNARANPKGFEAFTLPQTRPDGSPKGQSKSAGLKDVEAYSDLYYHQNVKYYNGDRTISNPVGFYIVLWDSGQVAAIPYDKMLYVPSGLNEYNIAFPGEAGVPKSALTYQQLYATMKHS